PRARSQGPARGARRRSKREFPLLGSAHSAGSLPEYAGRALLIRARSPTDVPTQHSPNFLRDDRSELGRGPVTIVGGAATSRVGCLARYGRRPHPRGPASHGTWTARHTQTPWQCAADPGRFLFLPARCEALLHRLRFYRPKNLGAGIRPAGP